MKDFRGPRYLVYTCRGAPAQAVDGALPRGYRARMWRPSVFEPTPRGLYTPTLAVWTIFHALHIFANHEYGQLLIYHGNVLAHRSGVFPGSLRFPFMGPDDLQIGDTWTHSSHRGQGLARFAIREIVERHMRLDRTFWYIAESHNAPSIRAVEHAGFVRTSDGVRTTRFGSRLLGAYALMPLKD